MNETPIVTPRPWPQTEWEKTREKLVEEANSNQNLMFFEANWDACMKDAARRQDEEALASLNAWGVHGLRHCGPLPPREILTAIEAVGQYNEIPDLEIPDDHDWYQAIDRLIDEYGTSAVQAQVLWLTTLDSRNWDADSFEALFKDHRGQVFSSKAEWAKEHTRETVTFEVREQLRQQLHYIDWSALAEDKTFTVNHQIIDIDGSVYVFREDPSV